MFPAIFAALQEAFQGAAEQGHVVMVATFSKACPVSEAGIKQTRKQNTEGPE
jgi:hypothetical protein